MLCCATVVCAWLRWGVPRAVVLELCVYHTCVSTDPIQTLPLECVSSGVSGEAVGACVHACVCVCVCLWPGAVCRGLLGMVPGVLQPAFRGWCVARVLAPAAAVCVVCMENRVMSWGSKGLLGVIQCTPTYLCM